MGKKNHGKLGLALLTGATVGYVASLFVSNKVRKAHKQKISKTADELASKLMSDDDKQRLIELFDSASKKGMKELKAAKKELALHLTSASQTLSQINKPKYYKAVEKTISHLKDKGSLDTKQLKKLRGYLESDYQLFKEIRSEVTDDKGRS